MTTLREAAQQALEALMWHDETVRTRGDDEAIEALRAALAEEALQRLTDVHQEIEAALEQPEQGPVAWIDNSGHPHHIRYWQGVRERQLYGPLQPLFTYPPRREWRGLTEEEINEATFHPDGCMNTHIEFARAIEAALKERNHE